MASDALKRRSKSGAFPAKFRTLVSDMKRFKIHRREKKRTESEGVMADPNSTPLVFQAPQIPEAKPVSPRNSLFVGNLAVQVTITFDEPLNYSYSRTYEASPSLQATEVLCQGLLRRIDHCCHEMITRKDSTAMEYAAASGSDKPLRFEIQIDIIRGWSEIWASRTFKSYQKQPLTAEAASQIILSTHYVVGLFLRRHDEGFVWKGGPVRDDPSQELGKFPHRAGRVQPMSCVPRFYFLERPQTFESIPGYTINFSFASECQRRKPSEWHTTVEVNSRQTAPLNSIGAEILFFEASYALESALRSERRGFDAVHRLCASLDGCKNCRHHDSDGLELRFSITNNMGPQFPELERIIRSSSSLSFYSDIQDCLAFVNRVENALSKVRDDADDTISRMNDLEFRITELRGRGWSLDEPLIFVLDPFKSYSQRTIEAMLDRIQAGVADILRGNAISVRMTAHKRGHFILDKTFVARDPFEVAGSKKPKPSRKSKAYVLDQLRQRIERDIAMVCKDTLTVDDIESDARAEEKAACVKSPPSQDVDAATSSSGLDVPGSVSNDTTEQHEASTYPTTSLKTSATSSVSKIITEENSSARAMSGSEATEATGTEELTTLSDTRPPEPVRRPSEAIHCSKSGARAFPLVPGLEDYAESESSGLDEDSNERDSQLAAPEQPFSETGPPRTPNGTHGSEEKRLAPTTNLGEEPESGPTYAPSTGSSTPSLVFGGGGSSPSSSLLITPKTHRLSTEADYTKNAIVDSDEDDGRDSESINSETRQDFPKAQLLPSPKLRHAGKPITSSPLRVSETIQEKSSISMESGGVPLNSTTETSSLVVEPEESPTGLGIVEDSKPEISRELGAEGIGIDSQGEEETTGLLPSIEIEASSYVGGSEPHITNVDDFSQSKPGFMFSSPPAMTPEGSVNGEHTTKPRPGEASPDPSEDSDTSPFTSPRARRTLESHRRSFGSAGMLGFHEQMFGSVSFRSALMRSRPTYEFGDAGQEVKRPGTAI